MFRKNVLLNIIANVLVRKWWKKRREFGLNISKTIQNKEKSHYSYKINKKTFNKVFYNIKIAIFVPEIKSESLSRPDDLKHV